MAQRVRWGGHLVQIWSGELLLERFRESTMADRSPDQVLGCSCFQDQKVNQFDGWVSRGQCTRSRLHRQYFTSQQIVSFSLNRELFDAIFSIHKWTQFALTLYMFLFHSTRRSRWSFVLRNKKIKIWNTNGQNVIDGISSHHFKDLPNSISSPRWWKETQFCWQAWSHLRGAFYHKDYSILDGIQKFPCKYFLFGEKEWPLLRTLLHVWSKGDILDLSSWEAQCTTAASNIVAK